MVILKIKKKYVRHMYLEKFLLNLNCKEDEDCKKDCKEDDFEIKILKKICFHVPCLTYISNDDNYCSIHNKVMI